MKRRIKPKSTKEKVQKLIYFTTEQIPDLNDRGYKLGTLLLGFLTDYSFLFFLIDEDQCQIECFNEKGFRIHAKPNLRYKLNEILDYFGFFISAEILSIEQIEIKGTRKIFKIS